MRKMCKEWTKNDSLKVASQSTKTYLKWSQDSAAITRRSCSSFSNIVFQFVSLQQFHPAEVCTLTRLLENPDLSFSAIFSSSSATLFGAIVSLLDQFGPSFSHQVNSYFTYFTVEYPLIQMFRVDSDWLKVPSSRGCKTSSYYHPSSPLTADTRCLHSYIWLSFPQML